MTDSWYCLEASGNPAWGLLMQQYINANDLRCAKAQQQGADDEVADDSNSACQLNELTAAEAGTRANAEPLPSSERWLKRKWTANMRISSFETPKQKPVELSNSRTSQYPEIAAIYDHPCLCTQETGGQWLLLWRCSRRRGMIWMIDPKTRFEDSVVDAIVEVLITRVSVREAYGVWSLYAFGKFSCDTVPSMAEETHISRSTAVDPRKTISRAAAELPHWDVSR